MNAIQVVSIIFLLLILLVVPALFIYWVGFCKSRSKVNFILKLLTIWTYFTYIFYAGPWSFLPFMLRYVSLFLLAAATIRGLMNTKGLVWFEKKNWWGWTRFSVQCLFSLLFFFACMEVISGFTADEKGIDIAFPLKEGFIGHGGNSVLINYHHADTTAQQYALDISKLNGWGMRASGFFPKDLHQYAIYGDTLFCPCDARVVVVKDGLPNFPPGTEDKVNLAGNHIVLEYQNNLIVFAHLLKNSIIVSLGDKVQKGQPMALIGNSGHTSEPHLHIHAVEGTDTARIIKGGNGIPIYFDGKFLTRNDRVKK